MSIKIHHTAEIDEGCRIGEGTKVWHWTHISSKVTIGENCSLGQNVFVGDNVIIGNNCKIQNNVSVYDNVTLEDYVFCGPSVVFTNVYNPRSKINRKNEYKETIIKYGSSLGANSTIICGVTLGKFCFIAAGSVITKNVRPYALMAGNPANQKGWMTEYGIKIPTLLKEGNTYLCEFEKKTYMLKNGLLVRN